MCDLYDNKYKEGYQDGVVDATQKMVDSIMAEVEE